MAGDAVPGDPAMPGTGFLLISLLEPDNPAGRLRRPDTVRVNQDLHLVHVVQGGVTLHLEGRAVEASAGDVLWVPPFRPYRLWGDLDRRLVMRNFHFLCWSDGRPLHRRTVLPERFRPRNFAAIAARLADQIPRFHAGGWERMAVAAELHGLVLEYLRDFGSAPEAGDAAMERLARRLAEPSLKGFDASILAGELGLSPSQMNRRFRAACGCAPKRYWLRCRLQRAQGLLGGGLGVVQTARLLGFDDPSYFARWFRNACGSTPSAYLRHAQEQGTQEL